MNVRPLTLPDIPEVCAGAARIHALSTYAHMNYSESEFAGSLTTAVSHPERFFAEVIEHDREHAGLLLAACQKSWFGTDMMASDILFYLLPEHWNRGGFALKKIVGRYEFWARERKAKVIPLGCSTGIQAERTGRTFEKLGFPRVGSLHAIRVE